MLKCRIYIGLEGRRQELNKATVVSNLNFQKTFKNYIMLDFSLQWNES